MDQNNGNHRIAAVDVIDHDRAPEQITTKFYDSNSPELKAAKQVAVSRKKAWKRKLVGWCFVLLLIFGGAVALYLLLRVNRVDVKVQADSRRGAQSPTPDANSNNPDNTLTAEAINIARAAGGADNSSVSAIPSPSPNAMASPSPSPPGNVLTNYSFTGNKSPVYEPFTDPRSNGDNGQQTNTGVTQNSKAGEPSLVSQNHANVTQSIFVGEDSGKLPSVPQSISAAPLKSVSDKKPPIVSTVATPPAVRPPFGTMLPVRTQGVIFTLRNNSFARMELTRDIAGEGWSLPKGTVFVGRTSGNEYDRAFVNVIGYIDPRDNRLVKMSGDVMGVDGAGGIQGKRIGVDRSRFKQTLRKVAASGVQVAGMMVGALTGRGTVVIDGAGYRIMNPITNDARDLVGNGAEKTTFVKVEAGRPAYVMVVDLPKSVPTIDAPGDAELAHAANSLTDREVMELILLGSPDEIRAALPLMTDEQKRLAIKSLTPEVYK